MVLVKGTFTIFPFVVLFTFEYLPSLALRIFSCCKVSCWLALFYSGDSHDNYLIDLHFDTVIM